MRKGSRVELNLNAKKENGTKSSLNNKPKALRTKKGNTSTNLNEGSNTKNKDDEYAYDSSDEEDIRYKLTVDLKFT